MTGQTPVGDSDSVWNRLRRRKVVQWGIAYTAAAWGLLQGIGFVADAFGWPDVTKQIATLGLLLGLPIVLVLAWYHGDRGEQQFRGTELTIIALLLLVGGGVFWRYQNAADTTTVKSPPRTPQTAVAPVTDHSIAVLPFVNTSSDKEQEYFADGISEELLNLLAQVPELRVIARTSSFSFKGKEADIAEIARKLNVANVLEGSVRKSGDTLRINAELIRTSDSSHLWSQTYDRKLNDVFLVQNEIAAAVVSELKIKLLGAAPKLRVTDPQAYALFLRGRAVMLRKYNPESLEQAIALYKRALAVDADYAPAWDALAYGYFSQLDLRVLSTGQGLPLARKAIERAIEVDRSYAPIYARAALIEGLIERDLAAAARHIEQGTKLDPANYDVISSAVWIARRLGRLEQASRLAEFLVARDPVNPEGYDRLAQAYILAGHPDQALEAFRTILALDPEYGGVHDWIAEALLQQGDVKSALAEIQQEPVEVWRLIGLARTYHALGREVESDAALDELIRKHAQTSAYNIAYILAYRGEVDRSFEFLNKAVEYRDLALGALPFDPTMTNLHSDRRWLPLLRRLGMAPEQLAAIKFDVTVPK